MATTTEQRPTTDGGELIDGFDPHPGDPWHPDWTPPTQAVDDLPLLEETQTAPTSAEQPTVDAPSPSLPREDRDIGEGPSLPVEWPTDDLIRPEETPTVEDRDTGDHPADWLAATEVADDLALLEEISSVAERAEEAPTVDAPPPLPPREDPMAERPSLPVEWPTDVLIHREEAQGMAARANETPTITLPASFTHDDITATETITVKPAAGLRDRVPRARFALGLVGLFVVYVTVSLALAAVVPAVGLRWTSVVITSGSMSPTFRIGHVVVASPHDGIGLGPGTVVVFSDPARPGLLTHRIESVNPDGSYVTRGDANAQPDSTPLHPEQVVGVGRLLVPLIGLPLVWYWAGAWGKLVVWAAGTLLALWLARYALLQKYEPRAQPEESGHVPQ